MNDQPIVTTWAPKRSLVVISWSIVAVLVLVIIALTDIPGQLLCGVAAILIALYAGHLTAARPRLEATEDAFIVKGLYGTVVMPRATTAVEVRTTRRLGRDGHLLELDGTDVNGVERLVLLGLTDLGVEPSEVQSQLR